ncbi:methylated-DNA--[protein]-cysteine S-methyltransferase [Polynucleobacter sp. VK25]|jgi:methylated-DNA-[protein]-cysteine S-methyltransferase|uniref:methylated-DNA--[protein]-cysteine S-methyltransferase n=1 Tax=Polynucleobacter sp. VK25 TaxID=1758398 RepID=UPI001BFED26E|nr:methylated-DNA--[protein]-cysteine S-methyltransferase [Polynucleobacter sp. VK25]QWD68516.1 methylated-DNA--[protein]-cysteine S-methyltransferase [Polynucleobacter sp. VK25]
MTSLPTLSNPNVTSYCVIKAPFGCLGISTELVEGSLMLSRIDYLPSNAVLVAPQNQLAKEIARQCNAYFKDPHWQFDLPTKPVGTEHQRKVWTSTQDIPVGKTRTYGEVAKKIKSGARAVGTACGANPYPLITPCHRVVSAQGIGGFMKENAPGLYRQIKFWLLEHEGVL